MQLHQLELNGESKAPLVGHTLNLVTFFKGRGKSLEVWWETNKGFNSTSVPNLTEPSSSDPGSLSKPLAPSVGDKTAEGKAFHAGAIQRQTGEGKPLPLENDLKPYQRLQAILKLGDLSEVSRFFAPLTRTEARDALFEAGFSMGFEKTKKELMTAVTPKLMLAIRNKTDGFGLRGMTKSLPLRILFMKSLSRPAPIKAAPAKPTAKAKAPASYGHHNVDEGDALHFAAGSFKGKGKVKSVGESGAVLEDDTGRAHNVHWHEITGRHQANHKPEPARSAAP